jgi:hypothetical protein
MEQTDERLLKKRKTMKIRLGKPMKPAKKIRLHSEDEIQTAIIKISQALSNNYGALRARYEWLKKLILRYRDHPEIWSRKEYKTYWDHLLLTAEALKLALETYIHPLYKKENNFFGQHVMETAQKRKDDKRLADLQKKKLMKMKAASEKKEQESPEIKPEEELIEVDVAAILDQHYSADDVLKYAPSPSENDEDLDLLG